jgi:hypothetical protein
MEDEHFSLSLALPEFGCKTTFPVCEPPFFKEG